MLLTDVYLYKFICFIFNKKPKLHSKTVPSIYEPLNYHSITHINIPSSTTNNENYNLAVPNTSHNCEIIMRPQVPTAHTPTASVRDGIHINSSERDSDTSLNLHFPTQRTRTTNPNILNQYW